MSINSYVLDTLDVSGCTVIKSIECENSPLTALGLTDCTALQTLYCRNNQLSALDLSKNTALQYVCCSPQKISGKPITFGNGTYPFKFAFSSVMQDSLISGIIAEFAGFPAEIDYEFATGYGDTILSVNITIKASGGGTSPTAPVIMASAITNGVTGISCLAELYAAGTRPITWTLTSENLPEGLEFSSSGTIQGAPLQTGEYNFTVQAQNSAGTASGSYAIRITESRIVSLPSITTTTLQDGTAVKASGVRPMIWALTAGDLPDGLEFTDEGKITGTPTTAGTYKFTVQAQNSAGIGSRELTLKIAEAFPKTRPVITTDELDPAAIGTNYIFQLTASGTEPIKWPLAKNSKLPKDMTLSEPGIISGIVPKNGNKKITVTAANDQGTSSSIFKLENYELP